MKLKCFSLSGSDMLIIFGIIGTISSIFLIGTFTVIKFVYRKIKK